MTWLQRIDGNCPGLPGVGSWRGAEPLTGVDRLEEGRMIHLIHLHVDLFLVLLGDLNSLIPGIESSSWLVTLWFALSIHYLHFTALIMHQGASSLLFIDVIAGFSKDFLSSLYSLSQ